MNINRDRSKKIKTGNNIEKIPVVFDLIMLDCFCRYVLTDSRNIRKKHLINLSNLIEILDLTNYENDPEKMKRIYFIKAALKTKLEKRISNPVIILQDVSAAIAQDIDFIDIENFNLSIDEMQWVSDTVSETLKYAFIYKHIDNMQDLCTRFKSTDYRYRGAIVKEYENAIIDTRNSFRKAEVDSTSDMMFSLKQGVFEEAVTDTYNLVTSPSRRLLCGMQGINELTGGGFENGRVYMFFGIAAVGKSMFLLNLLYQIKRYNTNYKTKDPTKTPCIVLLTMENSVVETITRLFSIISDGRKMQEFNSPQEVIDILKKEGELVLNDESPIDIIIKYKPNRSVDTSYLYTLTEDLEDEGYEVIMFLQDHVKRIRSIYKQPDLRIELGEIVNEFKSFAIDKDIPVISISHLNREAAKILENISASKKNIDSTKQLGKSVVSESFLMIDNLDLAVNINIDYDEQGNRYMGFNVTKQRDDSDREYIAQPFVQGSKIRLVEDFYAPIPLFKESLHESNMFQGIQGRENIRNSSYSDISALDGMFKDEKDDIFEVPTKYTNMTPLDESIKDEYIYDIDFDVVGKPSQPIEEVEPITFMTNTKSSKEAIHFF